MVTSDAPCWYALLRHGQLPRETAKRIIYQCCVQEGRALVSLLDLAYTEIADRYDLARDVAISVLRALQTAPAVATRLEALEEQGIHLMVRTDVAFPEALGERLAERWVPYFLFCQGDPVLLSEPGLCVLGGAGLSASAADVSRALGEAVAQRGLHLLGGYARGADRVALDAARQAGGQVTIMLPMGLAGFSAVARDMRRELEEGRTLLLSPFEPEAPPSASLGDARLVPLMAMSEVVLLVAPDRSATDWPDVPEPYWRQDRVLIWSGTESAVANSFVHRGGVPFDTARDALSSVSLLLGIGTAAQTGDADEREVGPADGFPDVEPIAFADADTAIESLGRTGKVPGVLAQRLHEAEWPNDLEYLVRHDDLVEPQDDDSGQDRGSRIDRDDA